MSEAPEKKEEVPPANVLLPADLEGRPQDFVREQTEADYVSRRNFVTVCVIGGGALVAGQAGYAAARYLLSAGRVEAKPTPVAFEKITAAGYQFKWGEEQVLVIKVGDEYRAFKAACTHLSCLVKWLPEKKVFFCPCHTGYFRADGTVLSGPPPRPLYKVPLVVEKEKERVIVGVEAEKESGKG